MSYDSYPELPVHPEDTSADSTTRNLTIGLVVLAVLLLAGLIAAVYFLMQPGAPTESLRDILIILVAFEFLIIGFAMLLLVVQLARLVNLLNNEVRPILESATEAAETMRGTTRFISDKLVAPIVKVNSSAAALRRALDLLRLWVNK
ncbi:MAG: hypothetical protein KIS85_04255 [Anaerolineales bacterium]|nr:hypothetical protein [Anaerolineales bacterium]